MAQLNTSAERWVPVPGYPRYSVSSLGRVVGPRGIVLSPMRTGTRRPGSQRSKVRVCTTPRVDIDVAHMVLLAFIGPRPDGYVAMHSNDDSADNRVDNLRWGTKKENSRDCAAKGRAGRQKLYRDDKLDVLAYKQQGVRNVDIATYFGVSQQRICDVLKGRTTI